LSQCLMLRLQLFHNRTQFFKTFGGWEDVPLLGRKVDFDFLLDELLNLRLPVRNISRLGAVDPNTKRQRMLMLPRKRNEALVTKHARLYCGTILLITPFP